MMQPPLVSVVIPVCRDMALAGRAVDSAAADGVEIVADGVRWVFARGGGNQMNAGSACSKAVQQTATVDRVTGDLAKRKLLATCRAGSCGPEGAFR
jgi:hypothetical protein